MVDKRGKGTQFRRLFARMDQPLRCSHNIDQHLAVTMERSRELESRKIWSKASSGLSTDFSDAVTGVLRTVHDSSAWDPCNCTKKPYSKKGHRTPPFVIVAVRCVALCCCWSHRGSSLGPAQAFGLIAALTGTVLIRNPATFRLRDIYCPPLAVVPLNRMQASSRLPVTDVHSRCCARTPYRKA